MVPNSLQQDQAHIEGFKACQITAFMLKSHLKKNMDLKQFEEVAFPILKDENAECSLAKTCVRPFMPKAYNPQANNRIVITICNCLIIP